MAGEVDIKVTYTWLGIAVAMAFTSIPFVVRTVQPVLEELGPEYEEAAETLGATRWAEFLQSGAAGAFSGAGGGRGAVVYP